jgi:hypothetical protein
MVREFNRDLKHVDFTLTFRIYHDSGDLDPQREAEIVLETSVFWMEGIFSILYDTLLDTAMGERCRDLEERLHNTSHLAHLGLGIATNISERLLPEYLEQVVRGPESRALIADVDAIKAEAILQSFGVPTPPAKDLTEIRLRVT